METIATIGLDLAKNVFQVHCVDGVGNVVIRRQPRRSEVLKFFTKVPACLIGMERSDSVQGQNTLSTNYLDIITNSPNISDSLFGRFGALCRVASDIRVAR